MALRAIVKHSYVKAFGSGRGRAKAHINYIKFRPGKDKDEGGSRAFFTDKEDGLTTHRVHDAIDRQTGRGVLVHKLIISPGVQDANTQEYVREVMHDLGRQKGLELEWYAVEHRNTSNPHSHVVVMGTDKNGRQVKLSKDDYTKLKEKGDQYLERNKLLDKEKLKETKSKSKHFGKKLKEALKAAKGEFDRVMKSDDETKKLSRLETIKAQELDFLGDAPNYDQIAAKRLAKEEQQKAVKEESWKYYSKAIEANLAGETVQYSWTMSLTELRDLELRSKDGGLISESDRAKLQVWIKDSYFEEKALERRVQELEKIEIERAEVSKSTKSVSKESSLEELKEAQELTKSGVLVLSPVEERALSLWVELGEFEEPINIAISGVEEPVVYDKQDSRESLEFLASEYRKGEEWAREGITDKEYKKLRQWIKHQRHQERDREKEQEKPREPEKVPDGKEEHR